MAMGTEAIAWASLCARDLAAIGDEDARKGGEPGRSSRPSRKDAHALQMICSITSRQRRRRSSQPSVAVGARDGVSSMKPMPP